MAPIKIVIADDQTLITQSLKIVIESMADDITIVGMAKDGREAIELVEREQPHVILMDVRMPNIDGVEATGIIHRRYPDVQIIVLTTFDDDEYVTRAIESGAVGYLLKDISTEELISAIRAVHHGSVILSQSVAPKLFRRSLSVKPGGETEIPPQPKWYASLTQREKEILLWLCQGLSNKEIAHKLCLAEQTVKNYLVEVYSKIGVSSRRDAVRKMKKVRLVSL